MTQSARAKWALVFAAEPWNSGPKSHSPKWLFAPFPRFFFLFPLIFCVLVDSIFFCLLTLFFLALTSPFCHSSRPPFFPFLILSLLSHPSRVSLVSRISFLPFSPGSVRYCRF